MLPSARLFAVYYVNQAPGEGPGNFVVLATSTDKGLSWRETQTVSPGASRPQERAYDSEIWLAPDGALWWFWAQTHSEKLWDTFDGRCGVWGARCAVPDCDTPVWEPPRRLGEGIMMNKPTILADGTWLLCASLWAMKGFGCKTPCSELGVCNRPNVLLSHDNGTTFEFHPGPRVPQEVVSCDEHMAVEHNDGTIWMLIRTQRGIYGSTSADGGKSWNDATPLPFGSLETRFSICRLKSGQLALGLPLVHGHAAWRQIQIQRRPRRMPPAAMRMAFRRRRQELA